MLRTLGILSGTSSHTLTEVSGGMEKTVRNFINVYLVLVYISVFQSEDFVAEMETRLRNCSR